MATNVAVYVDDVIVFSKRAEDIMNDIQEIYKMKGVGKPELYLGGNMAYFPGSNVMFTSAEKYLTTLLKRLEDNMGIRLKNYSSPMEVDYHPELESKRLQRWETKSTRSTGCWLGRRNGRSRWGEQTSPLRYLQWPGFRRCLRKGTCWRCTGYTVI